MASVTAQYSNQSGVFAGALQKWITAFWATALSTNLMATRTCSHSHECTFLTLLPLLPVLLICRIWYVDHKATRLRSYQQSQLRPILQILIDAGAIYSLTLLVALICFVSRTNGQYVVLDMVSPSYLDEESLTEMLSLTSRSRPSSLSRSIWSSSASGWPLVRPS